MTERGARFFRMTEGSALLHDDRGARSIFDLAQKAKKVFHNESLTFSADIDSAIFLFYNTIVDRGKADRTEKGISGLFFV